MRVSFILVSFTVLVILRSLFALSQEQKEGKGEELVQLGHSRHPDNQAQFVYDDLTITESIAGSVSCTQG